MSGTLTRYPSRSTGIIRGMKQVALRLDDDLAAKIDQAAGQVPRERWIKNTLRSALEAESASVPALGNDGERSNEVPASQSHPAPPAPLRAHPPTANAAYAKP